MTCDNCKSKPAEVFLTHIVDGKMQKVNLCKPCSKEKGVEDPTGYALADLLSGMGENTQLAAGTQEFNPATRDTGQKCPVCGFTQADFKKTGRLGCSECYQTFGDSLGSLLKAMHKGTAHLGKVPQRVHRQEQLTQQMRHLRQDLEKAVRDENYEGAASLRDQIRQLETQLDH